MTEEEIEITGGIPDLEAVLDHMKEETTEEETLAAGETSHVLHHAEIVQEDRQVKGTEVTVAPVAEAEV